MADASAQIFKQETANTIIVSAVFIVGMVGFEPTTSPTRTARAGRAAPHPEYNERDYNCLVLI